MKKRRYFVLIGLSGLCAAAFFTGCSRLILLDPKGPIGDTERFVILTAFALMLIVVIPVFIMAFWFPWKYRAGNPKATYLPKWSHSAKIEWVIWLVPAVIVTCLSVLVWHTTYHLDPYKPIDSAVKPLRIEAVSLDWKWLFIYPDQQIAVVNELVFPAHVPLSFRITSATVMTSFFIPQLGSQIYAMGGMQTRLHLLADEPGRYAGQNQQYSGRGYSDMNFTATALSREQFEAWIQKVRKSGDKLDPARLEQLETPSVRYPVTYFSSVKAGLFDRILHRFGSPRAMKPGALPQKPHASEGS
jgi:cytochrome o ubiquinol oxidase subunit 2